MVLTGLSWPYFVSQVTQLTVFVRSDQALWLLTNLQRHTQDVQWAEAELTKRAPAVNSETHAYEKLYSNCHKEIVLS